MRWIFVLMLVVLWLVPKGIWWITVFFFKNFCVISKIAGATLVIGLAGFGTVYGPDLRRAMELDLEVERHSKRLQDDEVTDLMKLVLQAHEDERFEGRDLPVDARSVSRAAYRNVFHGGRQGASTITMQVSRTVFLPKLLDDSREESLRRKLMEVVLAFRIEHVYSKAQIINLYFDAVPFAGARPGFRTASLRWFGMEPTALNVHEVSALVYSARAPGRINTREELIVAAEQAMRNAALRGHLAAKPGTKIPLELRFYDGPPIVHGANSKPRPQDEWSPGLLLDHLRSLEREVQEQIDREHLGIQSTINPKLQSTIQRLAVVELTALQRRHPDFSLELAVAVVSANSGDVLALVQRDPQRQYSFNTQSLRQIGSLEKPILLLAALQSGAYAITHQLPDAPLANGYPRNFGGRRYGNLTLQEALEVSANTIFVRLFQDDAVRIRLEQLHSSAELPLPSPDLSTALGTIETSNLRVASVYAAIASGGIYHRPRMVRSISTVDGTREVLRVPPFSRPLAKTEEILAVQTAMRSVYLRGTGTTLPRGLLGGVKTGTTSSGVGDSTRDLRFVYVLPDKFVVSIWIGCEKGSLWPQAAAGTDLAPMAGAIFAECERMLQ